MRVLLSVLLLVWILLATPLLSQTGSVPRVVEISCGQTQYYCLENTDQVPIGSWCENDRLTDFGISWCNPTDAQICGRLSDGTDVEVYGRDRRAVRLRDAQGVFSEIENLEPQGDQRHLRCTIDILVHRNYVVVRNGWQMDLFWLIGVRDRVATSLFTRLQDGTAHGVTQLDSGPLLEIGDNDDVYIQYCFDGDRWTSSDVHRGQFSTSLACNSDAINFFNVSSISYVPPRQRPLCVGYPRQVEFQGQCSFTCTATCDAATGDVTNSDCRQIPGTCQDVLR